MESWWLDSTERAELMQQITEARASIIEPQSTADKYFFSHVLEFIQTRLVDDENARDVFDNWADKSASKFKAFLEGKLAEMQIPLQDKSGFSVITLKALASRPEFSSIIDDLHNATDCAAFLSLLLNTFSQLQVKWIEHNVAAMVSKTLEFITKTSYNLLVKYYSNDREANYMRLTSKMTAALFLNTFSKQVRPIDNLTQLNRILRDYLAVKGFIQDADLDLFQKTSTNPGMKLRKDQNDQINHLLKFNIKPATALIYSGSGKILGTGGMVIKQDRLFTISLETNLKLFASRGRTSKNDLDKLGSKLQEIKEFLDSLTPKTIFKKLESVFYPQNVIPKGKTGSISTTAQAEYSWSAYNADCKVDFHYFETELTPTSLNITIQDNFSYLMFITPDLIARLMELEDLKPLNAAKMIHTEYDGGDVDLDYTINYWQKTGEIKVFQKKRLRFREKDKANMALILDTTGSMEQMNESKICAVCGAHAALNCGHKQLMNSPSFRYCQFLMTILIYIFKDHVNNFLIGFINHGGTPIRQYAADEFDDLIFDIWNITGGGDTSYYALGLLKENYPDFFAGRNKKFLFIITDALINDVFANFNLAAKSGGKQSSQAQPAILKNAFSYLNMFATDENLNFIYLPIAPPAGSGNQTQHMDNTGLGFRAPEENNAFNCITKLRVKLHLIKLVETSNLVGKLDSTVAKGSYKFINKTLVVTNMEAFINGIEKLINYDNPVGKVGSAAIAYTIFFYKYYEKMFFSDGFKLGFVGELQRLVNMIKKGNMLELATGW